MLYTEAQMENTKFNVGIALIVLAGLVTYVLQQQGIIDLVALGEWVQEVGVIGKFIYGALFIMLGLLGISKIAMTVLAGVLFSFAEAMVITVIAATIAAVIAFFIGRHFSGRLHDWLSNHKKRSLINRTVYKIEEGADQNGFLSIAVLRLSFVPLMMTSYASGLIKPLRFQNFFWAILLTNVYMHFVYIFVGTSFRQSLPLFLMAIGVLILFVQTPKLIKQIDLDSKRH